MVRVISFREGDMPAAEKFKELALLSKTLYGVSVRRYVEMKHNQQQLYRLKKRFEKTRNKDMRLELSTIMTKLKQDIAAVLLESGQYRKALAIYATLSWKECSEAKYNGTARSPIEAGQLKASGRLLTRGLKRLPKSVLLLAAQGIFHQRSGNHSTAINYFNLALEDEPRNEFALFDKAVSLGELGQDKKAISILRKLFKKYPGDTKISEQIKRIEGKGENIGHYMGEVRF